jgi:hypothetical protein
MATSGIRTSPKNQAFEVYEAMDLGVGGWAVAPSTESRAGMQAALEYYRRICAELEESLQGCPPRPSGAELIRADHERDER